MRRRVMVWEGIEGMSVRDEIAALRELEALHDRENVRLGRLQNALMLAHPGDLRVMTQFPEGSWARLPDGWQSATELRVSLEWGSVPRGIRGQVGVSEAVADRIVRWKA